MRLAVQPGDAVKQTTFIDEKPNPQERQIAREHCSRWCITPNAATAVAANCSRIRRGIFHRRLRRVRQLSFAARHVRRHAGRAEFLSCVYRIREKNGFGVGLNHVVEVLTGADTEKIRKWGDAQLSTYGIGKEHSRPEWAAIGRELIRLGFLRQTAEKFSVLEITNEGRAALKERKKNNADQTRRRAGNKSPPRR